MAVTPQELDHLALLSRISLTEEEKARFGEQLNQIITFVEQLQACDVEGIAPMAHPQEGALLKPRKILEMSDTEEDITNFETSNVDPKEFLHNVHHPVVQGQIEVRTTAKEE